MTLVLRAGDRLAPDAYTRWRSPSTASPLLELVTWDDDVVSGLQHHDAAVPALVVPGAAAGRGLRRPGVRHARGDDPRRPAACGPVSPLAAWDLLLRADLAAERVGRVTRVLSSVPGRTRQCRAAEAVATVQRHLERRGLPGRAVPGSHGASGSRGS